MSTSLRVLLESAALLSLLPLLGRLVLGKKTVYGEEMAAGCLVLLALSSALAGQGWLRPSVLRVILLIVWFSALPFTLAYYSRKVVLLVELQRGRSLLSAFAYGLLFLLLGLRLVESFLPGISWDTLGYHLYLLRERLLQHDLSALFDVAVDRRVPLAGVLVKVWPMSLDLFGRAVSVFHWGLYVALLTLVYRTGRLCFGDRGGWWALLALASLPDYVVYALSAGDEALLALLAAAVVHRAAGYRPQRASGWDVLTVWCLLGLAVAVKLTALFFVPPLALWLFFSSSAKRLRWVGLLLAVVLASAFHLKTYSDYGGVYPFTRNQNLLYRGEEGGQKLVSPEVVRQQRELMGLARHENDRGFLDDPLGRLRHNLGCLASLPFGPFPWWGLLFMFFITSPGSPAASGRRALPLALFCLLPLLLSMVIWPFSPQALMRYHMPVWGPLLACCLGATSLVATHFRLHGQAEAVLLLLLGFALALESRVLYDRFSPEALVNPTLYWTDHARDGRLIAALKERAGEGGKVAYIGPSAFLLDRPAWVWSLGNESGWRDPLGVERRMEEEGIGFLAISSQAAGIDPFFDALVDYLQTRGSLVEEKSPEGGRIFSFVAQERGEIAPLD
ncbi:MAG: glycosyltransferase family 39 protein [Planctomycetes bacterium]|nr:glycosyltransferase family 39 protein [Planctomycetota bacterium]